MTINMQTLTRTGAGQALLIVLAACVLGFGYTGIVRRGLFSSAARPESARGPEIVTSTFLTYDEARTLYTQGGALFVDARHEYDFSRGHIKGAINLSVQDFDTTSPLLRIIPKDTLLVTYCDGEECNSSVALAKDLSTAGYSNVRVFFGGWKEWLAHNQPTAP